MGLIDFEETASSGYKYCGITLKRTNKGCITCSELSDKITKVDEKCQLLELDVERKKTALESLEGKLSFAELENTKLREEGDVNLTKLMIENKALECDKTRAEAEISNWKLKYHTLEMQMLLMKSGGQTLVQTLDKPKGDKDGTGTSRINTLFDHNQHKQLEGFKGGREFELKSNFDFSGKEAPHKIIYPSTPGVKHPYAPIVISDSDDDDNDLNNSRYAQKNSSSVGFGVSPGIKDKRTTDVEDHSSDEENPCCKKRKFACGVTSECESNNTKNQDNSDYSVAPETMNDLLEEEEEEEMEEDEDEKSDLDSKDESLAGFIFTSSDDSESVTFSNSDHGMAENKGMSSDVERKWEYEADMLADLIKFPELCMKGVCAIYRRHMSEQNSCQAALLPNGRGFNQIHLLMGSDLAEFMTGWEPHGDVKKSVKELIEFYPGGVNKCRKLAVHYSKQLFEIYKNREDPFFHPCW